MKVKFNLSLEENVKKQLIKQAETLGIKPSQYVSMLVMKELLK